MRVPFVDLNRQYQALKSEIDVAIGEVLSQCAFIGGSFPKQFEEKFAHAVDTLHCIGVANGTDAIYITLKMLGIGDGDEVITTASSWISTSEAISQTGAKPVFVDVDEYFNIDAQLVEDQVNGRTKAILPVHLYGQAACVDDLYAICKQRGLYLVEDCAQAHLSERNGQKVGTYGIAGTYSFYPGKNLGAYGDAGAIVTSDEEFAVRCRMYANHGSLRKHAHEMEGINSRMDGLQAAVLLVKLSYIEQWTKQRQENAGHYRRYLADIDEVVLPAVRPGSSHVYHLYVIRCPEREALRTHLASADIATGIHYPQALPSLKPYQNMGYRPETFPRAKSHQDEILSLPMYAELTEDMIRYVAETIKEFYQKH